MNTLTNTLELIKRLSQYDSDSSKCFFVGFKHIVINMFKFMYNPEKSASKCSEILENLKKMFSLYLGVVNGQITNDCIERSRYFIEFIQSPDLSYF